MSPTLRTGTQAPSSAHICRVSCIAAYSHISCISAYSRTFVSSNYAPVNRIYPINTSTKLMFEWDAMAADAYGVAMLAAILASAAASCIVKRTQERRVRMPTHKRAVGRGKPQRWPAHVRGAGLSNPAGSRPEEQRPARSKRRPPAPARDLARQISALGSGSKKWDGTKAEPPERAHAVLGFESRWQQTCAPASTPIGAPGSTAVPPSCTRTRTRTPNLSSRVREQEMGPDKS